MSGFDSSECITSSLNEGRAIRTLTDKVVVVTGAASGIGRALASQLAHKGSILALVDINATELEVTRKAITEGGGRATMHNADVASQEQVRRMSAEVIKRHGTVHAVVNNAGAELIERFDTVKYEDMEWVMSVNFWGIIHVTRAFLDHLVGHDDAHLVNVSSVMGLKGTASQTIYAASKFAVRGFTESLKQELRGTGVTVSCVYPGVVDTNLVLHARLAEQIDRDAMLRSFQVQALHSAPEAAAAIVKGILGGKERILIGADARLLDRLQRLFPASYDKVVSTPVLRKVIAALWGTR